MRWGQWLAEWGFSPLIASVASIIAVLVWFLSRKVQVQFQSTVKYLWYGIRYRIAQIVTANAAALLTLRPYCKIQLAGSSQYLHVPGLKDVVLDIEKIYVPLLLKRQGAHEQYNHENALSAGNRILIVGDPGSGKSSMAKRLFRDECRHAIRRPASALFPIFLELKQLPFDKIKRGVPSAEDFMKYLEGEIKSYGVYDILKCFTSFTQGNGVLLILDGLDEVSSADYQSAKIAINAMSRYLAKLGPRNKIVITLRTQFYRQIRSDFRSDFPILLEIQPFSPTDMYAFLDKWDYGAHLKTEQIARIFTELTDRPSLREICANPLVLSMYVAHDQLSGHPQAPESRTEFYQRIVEELLVHRRASQLGPRAGQAVIREQRLKILGRIAFEHVTDSSQPSNLLSWNDGVKLTRSITGLGFEKAEALLRHISVETGLITEERIGETFRFIHLTFCEFFSAFEAVQGDPSGWKKLTALHSEWRSSSSLPLRTRLIEVLPFACALMARHHRSSALHNLAKMEDYRLLAVTFIETKAYDHTLWHKFVTSQKERLLQYDRSNTVWLEEIHLFLVACIDAERASEVLTGVRIKGELDSFFQSFVAHADEKLYDLIRGYAKQDAVAAFRIAGLCKVDLLTNLPEIIVDNCDQPSFLALAIQQALKENERMDHWSQTLAEAGLNSRPVANALHSSPVEVWTAKTALIEDREKWYCGSTIPRTAFTECITCAVKCASEDSPFPRLNALRGISAPGAHKVAAVFISFEGIFLFLAWLGLVAITFGVVTHQVPQLPFVVFALVICVFFVTLWCRSALARFRIYRAFLAIQNFPSNRSMRSDYNYIMGEIDWIGKVAFSYREVENMRAFWQSGRLSAI